MTKTREELEEAVDKAIGEYLAGCSSSEEAEEALLNCFSSPILCLVAAAHAQGEPGIIPAVIGNCAKQSITAIRTAYEMHRTGMFAEIEKERKN